MGFIVFPLTLTSDSIIIHCHTNNMEVMMSTKKSAAEECCAKCEKDVAALRKEVAALKKELSKKSAGGADPRVDQLSQLLQDFFPNNADKFKLK